MLLAHVANLRYQSLELIEEHTMCGAVDRWYLTVIVEWEVLVRYLLNDVHDEFETCLLQIDFPLLVQTFDRLHQVPFKYLMI